MKTKVLAVDDESDFTDLVKHDLERQGCELLVASNGLQALRLARIELPDVILLDLMLPDMDGLSVCQILNAQPSTRHIPVVIVTALDESWVRTRRSPARFAKFLRKPLDLSLLGASIRVLAEQRLSQCAKP